MSKERPPFPALSKDAYLIDSHCHLDMDAYHADCHAVLQRASEHGVSGVITIGIDVPSSLAGIELAKRYPMVRAAVGIHPHDADKADAGALKILARHAGHCKKEVVGYGEIGLDYVKQYAPADIQRSVFRRQLALARELRLPVIIHDREAHDDCLAILRAEGPLDNGGVMHCFSGDLAFARKVIDLNLHVSIPGIVTYRKANDLKSVATHVPLDKIIVETDGPFLAPEPYRGKRNEPLYTLYTAKTIADLRGISIDEVAEQTSLNTISLFQYAFPTHASQGALKQ